MFISISISISISTSISPLSLLTRLGFVGGDRFALVE